MTHDRGHLRVVPAEDQTQGVDFSEPVVPKGWLNALQRSDQESSTQRTEEDRFVRHMLLSVGVTITILVGGTAIKSRLFDDQKVPNACTDSPSLVLTPGVNGAPNSAWGIATNIPGAIRNFEDFKEELLQRNPKVIADIGLLAQKPIDVPGDCE